MCFVCSHCTFRYKVSGVTLDRRESPDTCIWQAAPNLHCRNIGVGRCFTLWGQGRIYPMQKCKVQSELQQGANFMGAAAPLPPWFLRLWVSTGHIAHCHVLSGVNIHLHMTYQWKSPPTVSFSPSNTLLALCLILFLMCTITIYSVFLFWITIISAVWQMNCMY